MTLLKKENQIVKKVLAYEEAMLALTDSQLQKKTQEFKNRLKHGETLKDIQPEAYAVVREAARRIRMEHPFPVQVLGACVLHKGDVAEMATGSGKTLTATMPVYLNALEEKGVHVVTVNEYLAERDAVNMGMIYNFLGLSVGINKSNLSKIEKKHAFACDITYTTNSELGFDYLRDNMVYKAEDKVMRGLHFALIDEADSILIDESRTPLIISASQTEPLQQYRQADIVVKALKSQDVAIDIQTKQVYLKPSGITKVEKSFGIQNLYEPKYTKLVHRINQALKANFIMKKDIDYLVTNDEIHIIDQFTGRVLGNRQYSEGLHQAIQAKENVTVQPESKTVATITYQNLFRLYDKLAGMTGTAKTEEEEFVSIYNMRVYSIPNHKPTIREDLVDKIYGSQKAKYDAVVKKVKEIHATGRPVLIGTTSVEQNEYLHERLGNSGIPHEVLNAKNHAREAEIIAKAGQYGAVTLATNMAGRGTDIKLTEETRILGGLYVIGTEHHEARRIDNQLRGRSGRQGDPGTSQFYVALNDDLLKRFASEKFRKEVETKEFDTKGNELSAKLFTKSIVAAQKRVEGANFDVRKQLINYDDVLRKQREIIYQGRDTVLNENDMRKQTQDIFYEVITRELQSCIHRRKWDEEALKTWLQACHMEDLMPNPSKNPKTQEKILVQNIWTRYTDITSSIEPNIYKIEKDLYLHILDDKWQSHIDNMSKLREGIYLRSYAQNDPLQQYVKEAFVSFYDMMYEVKREFVLALCNIRIEIPVNPLFYPKNTLEHSITKKL